MSDDDSDPGWVASGFDDEQTAAFREAMNAAIAQASPNYGAALHTLDNAVSAVPPFDLICVTSFYFLTEEAGVNPEYNRPEDVFQHHVELIHAFALRHRLDEAKATKPLQDGIRAVVDAAKEVVHGFMLVEMAGISAQHDSQRRRQVSAIAGMRTHAATVRGWSYYTDLSQVLAELFEPLEPEIQDALGVSPTGLVAWWWAATEKIDERIASHRQRVHDILIAPADDAWPALVRDTFARLPAALDQELADRLRADEDQRQAFTIIAADLNLYEVFALTIAELRDCYPGPIEPEALERVLDTWSLTFGSTGEVPLHQLVQDNPVLSRPLTRLDRGLYLWSVPAAFNHSAFAMLEQLIEGTPELWASYTSRRAIYLEDRVARALADAFPDGRVMTNVLWVDPTDGKEYETDVLALVGSHAFIAECKSGRLSRPAQKGRGRWFRDDLNDLVVEPARQAQRFTDYLVGQSGVLNLATRDGDPVVIDASDIRAAINVGVTLEPLAGLLPGIGEIVESALTDGTVDTLTHSVTLFDLLVVLEMLEHPSDMLHYFLRRSQLERNQFLVGDETDLLGFYLLSGFNLGSAEFDDELQRMQVLGLSDPIDTYHYTLEAGKDAPKPRVRRSEWWESLLTTVEDRAGLRWTELGVALCNVAYDEQQEFEAAFEELRASVQRGDRPTTDFVLFANGPDERRDYFIGLVLSGPPSAGTRKQAAGAAQQVLAEDNDIQRVVVIGWPPVRDALPYHTLALMDRHAS
jgi:hypothetical protein